MGAHYGLGCGQSKHDKRAANHLLSAFRGLSGREDIGRRAQDEFGLPRHKLVAR